MFGSKGPPIGNGRRESNGHVTNDVTWPNSWPQYA